MKIRIFYQLINSTLSCILNCLRFPTMTHKKIIFGIFVISFLGGCASPTAMIGPAYTLTSTGNVVQAGLSYGTNELITSYTGKTPIENIKDAATSKNNIKKQTLESQDFHILVKNRIKKTIYDLIPTDNPGGFNQALMELGALLCTPKKPKCAKCPIAHNCSAYKSSKPEFYPLPKETRKIPHYIIVTGIIWRDSKFYIQKRDEKSMLGGLWEFPGGKVKNKESLEGALKREIEEECGIIPIIKKKIGFVDHSYSHFSISLHCFHCIEGEEKIQFSKKRSWITHKEIGLYPFPKANHKLFTLIKTKGWNV